MAVPANNVYIRWNFSLSRVGTSEDIAVFGTWWEPVAAVTDWDGFLADQASVAWEAWVGAVNHSFWCANVTLTSVEAVHYDVTGHTLNEQVFTGGTPWVGSSTAPALPWETSLAVSLYTYPRGSFVSNGRRKRGRYYLPPMSSAILDSSDSGYFDNTLVAGLLSAQVAFLIAAGKDIAGVHVLDLSVLSKVDDALRPVIQVSLDAKFDSQRRRENREVAGYLVHSI